MGQMPVGGTPRIHLWRMRRSDSDVRPSPTEGSPMLEPSISMRAKWAMCRSFENIHRSFQAMDMHRSFGPMDMNRSFGPTDMHRSCGTFGDMCTSWKLREMGRLHAENEHLRAMN